jgi:co-chaperonin GroES (HSP10)
MSDLNTSGFKPYDIGVLVRIKPHEEKKTAGGIILHETGNKISIEAQQTGILVEVGSRAFGGLDNPPCVGDTVFFAKYSGQFLYPTETIDKENYRAMDDHDIRLIRSK